MQRQPGGPNERPVARIDSLVDVKRDAATLTRGSVSLKGRGCDTYQAVHVLEALGRRAYRAVHVLEGLIRNAEGVIRDVEGQASLAEAGPHHAEQRGDDVDALVLHALRMPRRGRQRIRHEDQLVLQRDDGALQANNGALQRDNGALQADTWALQRDDGALQADNGALQRDHQRARAIRRMSYVGAHKLRASVDLSPRGGESAIGVGQQGEGHDGATQARHGTSVRERR
ncbi:MAG TPA: hypothetical protein VGY54_25555 [Polyangiaceae bacterium]|nr:hypothetical protein [Polyangiaceae bacterium]